MLLFGEVEKLEEEELWRRSSLFLELPGALLYTDEGPRETDSVSRSVLSSLLP